MGEKRRPVRHSHEGRRPGVDVGMALHRYKGTIERHYSNVRIVPDPTYLRSSRHDSWTKHPEKMKIGTCSLQAMEGRPRLRPGGYAGLAASSRPYSGISFGHAGTKPGEGRSEAKA